MTTVSAVVGDVGDVRVVDRVAASVASWPHLGFDGSMMTRHDDSQDNVTISGGGYAGGRPERPEQQFSVNKIERVGVGGNGGRDGT